MTITHTDDGTRPALCWPQRKAFGRALSGR